LEVKVKLKTLNKRFLEGNPSILLLSKKEKRKEDVSLPPFFPSLHVFPLPLVILFVSFIEDNENIKHGGCELIAL